MPKISIKLPPLDAEDTVEVTVVVNGKSRKYDYRMELFAWEEHAEPPRTESHVFETDCGKLRSRLVARRNRRTLRTRGIYPIRTPRIRSVIRRKKRE